MEQRWLSMTGICTVLSVSPNTITTLVRKKMLVKIGTPPNVRYLDPTSEYAALLKLGESIYYKEHAIPRDFNTVAFLTLTEMAEVLGWRLSYARQYVHRRKLPCIKVGSLHLYSIAQVRKIMWARQGRKLVSNQKSPFLLTEIVWYFSKHYKKELAELPTDAEFAEDALLQKKIQRMMRMPSPARELALKDFMGKIELAKQVVTAVKS